MRRFSCFVILSSLLLNSYSQGLKFNGNETTIDERTSYQVFGIENKRFKDLLSLSLQISSEDVRQVGYILRIKTRDPNFILNLVYDSQGNDIVYKLNHEGRNTLITASFPKNHLPPNEWYNFLIQAHLLENYIELTIADKTFRCEIDLPNSITPQIYFGRSDYFIDVPSLSIKNLNIKGLNQNYDFPLRESEGNDVHDSKGKVRGKVENPVWLINKAYYWKELTDNSSTSVAGFNFRADTHDFYYFNRDSLMVYHLDNKRTYTISYKNKCPIDPRLGYNFFDNHSRKLYAYEVSSPLSGNVTFAVFDLATQEWSTISTEKLPRQLHHHTRFFDAKSNRLIIFGGFGSITYSNKFYSFDLGEQQWTTLDFTGDTIDPRYFSSMDYDEKSNSLYIFGGMGNKSGELHVGRRYYYDLHKVDLNTMHITKLLDIPWNNENVVPVRNMILKDDHFMVLCYPEHHSDTHLKLYKFSLADGSYQILGDSIPIHSEKITTNANLYYHAELSELYSVVQEFEDNDIASSLKIYSIASPPVTLEQLSTSIYKESNRNNTILWIILGTIATCSLIVGIRLWRKTINRKVKFKDINSTVNKGIVSLYDNGIREISSNSICIFGDFTIKDKHGKDITYLFSTRLKQAFILILQHSHQDGISSQQLTEVLWSDRDDDKAKNIRGVTINNIRKNLEELDGVELIHDKSCYKLVISEPSHCDYIKCMQLVSQDRSDEEQVVLINAISRGKLLRNEDDPIYDPLKMLVEYKIEPILKINLEESYINGDYLSAILLADAVFNIDPLSEVALSFLLRSMIRNNMNREAKKRYLKFAAEYKKMMGEDYKTLYSSIIM